MRLVLHGRSWARYAAPVLLPVAAFAIRLATDGLLEGFPFLLFFPAVLGAALVGGWRAGVTATVISELLAAYFLIEPRLSFAVGGPSGHAALLFFNLVCGTIIVLVHSTEKAMRRLAEAGEALRRTTETLELRVVERTRELADANAALRAEIIARKAMEAQALQAQKLDALGQLTGGIAHEFNNMLQAVSGSLEMMRRRLAKGRPDQLQPYLLAAADAADRIAATTKRLLAFARRHTLAPEPVDANALITGLVELIRRTVGPQVEIETRLADEVWPVLCDPGQLESALMNTAINARDAMPAGGTLTIATSKLQLTPAELTGHEGIAPGDHVQIRITDTGIGMTPDVLAHVFEPFFTTKPPGRGTGLGLAQLYGFVRQSRGQVQIDSTPGRGTTVRILLPRHSVPVAAESAGTPQSGGSGNAVGVAASTILLVEDEPLVSAVAEEALRELGCRVLQAGDGREALGLLDGGAAPDLLVSDIGLPGGVNGRQLADSVRARWPGLPVLLITGYSGGALEQELAPGMVVLAKPFALDTLIATVRRLLGRVESAAESTS